MFPLGVDVTVNVGMLIVGGSGGSGLNDFVSRRPEAIAAWRMVRAIYGLALRLRFCGILAAAVIVLFGLIARPVRKPSS